MKDKRVWLFREENATMRNLLGGKGANLAEMTNLGLPVPPGLTITTETCMDYINNGNKMPAGLMDEVKAALKDIEEQTGKKFGDKENPLLLSVQSSPEKFMNSIPDLLYLKTLYPNRKWHLSRYGIIEKINNIGLNDEIVEKSIQLTGLVDFYYENYRTLILNYGISVMGMYRLKCFDTELERIKKEFNTDDNQNLPVSGWKKLIEFYKKTVKDITGKEFPQNPFVQLEETIKAVYNCWNSPSAIARRGDTENSGAAVNIQVMVFGNYNNNSAAGAAFTRNPFTGENEFYGQYLNNVQIDDILYDTNIPKQFSELKNEMPEIYESLTCISKSIEKKNKDIQGIEFVVENGRLWILEICNSSKSPEALIRMLVEMEKENIITKREAILSVNPALVITTKTDEYFYTFLSWLNELKTINVGANIVHREEVHDAIRYDADLVGLFRTECLLPVSENVIDSWVYKLVNAKSREERQAAVLPLKKIQYDDYYYMLKVLSGKIFVLRLQDYPLFMFLPLLDEFTKAVIERKVNGKSLENDEVELEFLNKIHDTNSMLGLRGCRLGISYPELFEMQLEAIFEASCDLINEGYVVKPYIMSSFVSCVGEVKYFKELVEKTAKKVMAEKGVNVEYKFGTMIEIPRAALTSDEISPYVDFFSYGTNDLTQMTYGVSRTESVFDKSYLKMGIADFNPFYHLDMEGVGQLIKLSMQKGKQSNKNLTCGICGIQSREIHSVKDALDLGFDYISIDCNCIPQAKLISAQLALLKNS